MVEATWLQGETEHRMVPRRNLLLGVQTWGISSEMKPRTEKRGYQGHRSVGSLGASVRRSLMISGRLWAHLKENQDSDIKCQQKGGPCYVVAESFVTPLPTVKQKIKKKKTIISEAYDLGKRFPIRDGDLRTTWLHFRGCDKYKRREREPRERTVRRSGARTC